MTRHPAPQIPSCMHLPHPNSPHSTPLNSPHSIPPHSIPPHSIPLPSIGQQQYLAGHVHGVQLPGSCPIPPPLKAVQEQGWQLHSQMTHCPCDTPHPRHGASVGCVALYMYSFLDLVTHRGFYIFSTCTGVPRSSTSRFHQLSVDKNDDARQENKGGNRKIKGGNKRAPPFTSPVWGTFLTCNFWPLCVSHTFTPPIMAITSRNSVLYLFFVPSFFPHGVHHTARIVGVPAQHKVKTRCSLTHVPHARTLLVAGSPIRTTIPTNTIDRK